MLALALFVLGLLAALWSTVFAALEYRAERLIALDRLLHQILFDEILPAHAAPILAERAAQFAPCPPHRLFASLCLTQQLTASEFDTYTSLAKQELFQRRLWFPRAFLGRRVDDLAPQYVWRCPVLMPRLLDHLARPTTVGI